MTSVPNSPFPLVTITPTTDELAMICAGLIELRRTWSQRYVTQSGNEEYNGVMIERITELYDTLRTSVTPEQGSVLLGQLIQELKFKR